MHGAPFGLWPWEVRGPDCQVGPDFIGTSSLLHCSWSGGHSRLQSRIWGHDPLEPLLLLESRRRAGFQGTRGSGSWDVPLTHPHIEVLWIILSKFRQTCLLFYFVHSVQWFMQTGKILTLKVTKNIVATPVFFAKSIHFGLFCMYLERVKKFKGQHRIIIIVRGISPSVIGEGKFSYTDWKSRWIQMLIP